MIKSKFIFFFLILYLSKANAFNKYFDQLRGCKAASGYRIIGADKFHNHFKDEFDQSGGCESYDSLVKKAGKELDEEIQILLELLEEPVNPLCSELINLRKKFIVARPRLEKLSDSTLAQELRDVKNKGKKYSIQDVHNLLAYEGTMCGANSAVRELSMYVELGNELKELTYNGAPLIPQKNGDILESCRNVYVSGGGDLENFFIKVNELADYDFTVTYNSFTVPDKFLIMYGSNVLFSNGCSSTKTPQTKKIKFSKNNTKLSVKIIGDCSKPENERDYSSNAWTLQIQCNEKVQGGPPAEVIKKCDATVDKYLDQIDTIIKKHDNLIDTFWSRSMCFKSAHETLFENFVHNINKRYFPVFFVRDKKLLNAFLAEEKLYKKRKMEASKQIKTKSIQLADNLPIEPSRLLPKHKDFFMNRFKYCGKRPSENESLFIRISFSYCFYGYLKLFDEGHPIYAD